MSTITQCSTTTVHTTRRLDGASLDFRFPSTCHLSVVLSPVPVPVVKLALHDDGNLASHFLSSIDQSFDQSNDSIPNQVSTARNFPALSLTVARPERILRAIIVFSTAIIKSPTTRQPRSKGLWRTQNRYPKIQGRGKPNGPAATSRSGVHICTNKNGETPKATALQKEIVWLPSIRLAC
jgi:hypothetical protein